MRAARLCFGLIATIAAYGSGYAEPVRAVVMITDTGAAVHAMPPVPPATGGNVPRTIKRYGDPNKGDLKLLLGITEYDRITCDPIEKGTWTDPNPTIKPVDGNTKAGTVDFNYSFTQKLSNGECQDRTYTFAGIRFIWTLHKNLTATPQSGPTATFNGRWYTKDGFFNDTWTFQVTVPVVRPTGDTITRGLPQWDAWFGAGSVARFEQTLDCCDSGNNGDPDFDFTGEWVTERFTVVNNGCPVGPLGQPKGLTGNAPPAQAAAEAKQSSVGSSWNVDNGFAGASKNHWGPDGVGFAGVGAEQFCSIHYARCVQPTGCFNSVTQQMYITSPADRGFDSSTTPEQRDQSRGGTYIAPGSYDIFPYGSTAQLVSGTSFSGKPLPRDADGPIWATKKGLRISKSYTSHLYQCPGFYRSTIPGSSPPRAILPAACLK